MGKEKNRHRIGKKVMALLLMAALLLQTMGMQTFAANAKNAGGTAVTRMEWLKALSETFEFTIEADNYPDNYYSDLDSSSPDYYDAMLATEFGLIDLEEGEALRPNEAATREFAAHTLNLCLGYVLENDAFTFNEANAVTYPKDIQIAINQGWLSLSNGNFMPGQAITQSEKDLMIAAAKKTLASDNSSAGGNSYAYKAGVIVLPENVVINTVEENIFEIQDCPVEIKAGDIFGKVCNGIPLAWKAVKVERNGNNAFVTVDMVNTEEAFDSINLNQTNEADLSKIQPASENMELHYVVGGTEAQNYEDGAVCETLDEVGDQEVTAVMLEQTVDMPTAQADFNVGNAKIKVNAQISNLDYKTVSQSGRVGIDYTFKLDFNCNVSVDLLQAAGISPSYELFNMPVLPGMYVKGVVDLSFYGSANVRLVEDVQLGFHYENFTPRIVQKFQKDSFTVTANAKLRAGVRLEAGVKLVGLSGTISGKVGADITTKSAHYTDGKKPDSCQTISTYIYASVGYNVMVDVVLYKGSLKSGTFDIYTQKNSPVKTAFHYEDGKAVSKCTRGTKGMGYGGWGYFSPIDSQYYTIGGSSGGSYADGQVYTIFKYELNEKNQATITDYQETAVNVFIPETIDGYPVVGIKYNAFKDNQRIRSVSIPDCVKTIGYSAFSGCTALERVTFPENEEFTVIPSSAFYNCKNLANVTIPNSVTEINSSAFADCENLSEVKLSKSLTFLGYHAFANCKKITAIEIPKSLEGSTNYPSGGPFKGCINLKTVTFEKGATEIARCLFADCDGLEELTIPDTVTVIEYGAFHSCENLASITIPDSVTKIEACAFQDCVSLTTVTIPDKVTEIGNSAFSGCTALESAVLPKTLKILQDSTFQNCTALKQITLPNTLTTIDNDAFYNCDALESIALPESITKIYLRAFYDCDALSSVTIPYGVTEIEGQAFYDCDALTTLVISDTVREIGSNCFTSCDSLSDVTLSAYLTSIPGEAFMDCASLQKLVIPYRVESIGRDAFKNNTQLTAITIPKSVTEINGTAFSYPKKLTISGVSGSYANEFAVKQGIAFAPINIPAQELRLNKTELNLYPYDNFDLLAVVRPLDYTGDITFSASDETIVSVTETGRLYAKKNGSAMITVKAGEKTANCRVNVLKPVSRIDVENINNDNALKVNERYQLKWSVSPSDAANKKVTFRSGDEEIASVNESGLITAKKAGTVRIYIESEDGKASRTIDIEVKEQTEKPVETKNPSDNQTAAPAPTKRPSEIQTNAPAPTKRPSETQTAAPGGETTDRPGNVPTAKPGGNAPTDSQTPAPTETNSPVSEAAPQKINKNLVVSAEGMLEQIQIFAKDENVHTIETITNEEPVLKKIMLNELLENKKDLSIAVVDENYYLIYKWTFYNQMLQNTEKDANLSLTFSDSDIVTGVIQQSEKLDDVLTMQCASMEDLPGTATVQAYVGGKYKENEKLYLYSFDKVTKSIKRISQNPMTVKNGYVEFVLDKGGAYFFSSQLLEQAPEDPVTMQEWLHGDADRNGAVDLQDAQLILLAALGIQNQNALIKTISDVNLDGQVDLQDAQDVLQIALGIKSLEEIQKIEP